MTRNTILRLAISLGALLIAAGCGDASTDGGIGSKCEQMCQRADDCPNVYAESDCVSVCEKTVEAAAQLGGTCPQAVDAVVDCTIQLSCDELFTRALGGYYNDECVAKERAANQCVPGDPVEQPNSDDELLLACQAICDAGDDCPGLVPDADCVQGCYDGFGAFEDGTAACHEALVTAVNCQAALSCTELSNRVNQRGFDDSCTETDRIAEQLCL
jgi:hypothetical protein